jgi:hypothetical protein
VHDGDSGWRVSLEEGALIRSFSYLRLSPA